MTGLWLISYIVLWILTLILAIVVIALAREVEALHHQLDNTQKLVRKLVTSVNGEGNNVGSKT
jgi:uncharacterized protein YoxC